MHVSSPTPSRFLSVRVSLPQPLVSSLVSPGNSVEISWFVCLGPKSAKSAKYRGILRVHLETPGIPGKYPGSLPVSSVSPQILPGDQLSDSGKLEELPDRMELQTPSGFPENFRKRKVLGTLSFPFYGFRKRVCRPSCSENRRGTAKGDRKRQTTKG